MENKSIGDIICLKLLSGDEIIGKLKERSELNSTITLEDVASIYMVPGQSQTQVSLGLAPFLPYSNDSSFTIKSEIVIITHDPSLDLRNNYNRMFGSGIQIAQTLHG
jgi:hypothetical protein